jgi:hypothetical protein
LAAACGESKSSSSQQSPPTSGPQLPLDTGPAPWPDPDRVPQRTAAAGLVGGPTEILIVHYHAHLDIFVRLTDTCAGSYCTPATPVAAFVDGKRATVPVPDIVLKKGEEIALVIGAPPAQIPSSWNCLASIDPRLEAAWQCDDFGG